MSNYSAEGSEKIISLCKIFSNPSRLKLINLLNERPYHFAELLKELNVNPKVLHDGLNLLRNAKLLLKSYPYGVYTLTPLGHKVKGWLDSVDKYIGSVLGELNE